MTDQMEAVVVGEYDPHSRTWRMAVKWDTPDGSTAGYVFTIPDHMAPRHRPVNPFERPKPVAWKDDYLNDADRLWVKAQMALAGE